MERYYRKEEKKGGEERRGKSPAAGPAEGGVERGVSDECGRLRWCVVVLWARRTFQPPQYNAIVGTNHIESTTTQALVGKININNLSL
jgi:hypothetical protein